MGRATWLAIGLLAFLALVGLSLVWLHTPAGPRLDRVLAAPLIHDLPWWLRRLLSGLARRWLLIGLGALVALGLVRALRHRAYLAAVTALLVPALSLAWLSAIRDGWLFIGAADFPSGHTTLGAGLLVALAVLSRDPRSSQQRRCWLAAAWLAALTVIAVGNVTLHAHQPGDVMAALLLVTCVTGLLHGILLPRPVTAASPRNRGTMGQP